MFCDKCGTKLESGEQFCTKCGEKVQQEKSESLMDKMKNYDYKAKTEQFKEKASEMANKAKNFNYKGEADNIKNGGFMYFWGKYKKICIGVIALLLIIVILPNFFGDKTTKKVDGNICFSMTKNEFVKKYNDIYYKWTDSELYNPSEYPRLDEQLCSEFEPYEKDVEVYPHMEVLYQYDTTLYSGYGQYMNSCVSFGTDDDDNIIYIEVTRDSSALGTEQARNAYLFTDCASAISVLTDKSQKDAEKMIDKVASGGTEEEKNYEYLFHESNGKTSFIIRVKADK